MKKNKEKDLAKARSFLYERKHLGNTNKKEEKQCGNPKQFITNQELKNMN